MSGKNLKVSFFRENHKSKVVLQEVGNQGDYFFIEDQLKDKDNQFNWSYFDRLIAETKNQYLEELKRQVQKELHHEIKAGCQKEFELDFKNKEEYQKLIKGKNDLDNKVILLEKDLKNLQINQKQIITLEKSEIEKQLNQKFFVQIEELKSLLKEKEITITKLQAKVQVDISEAEKRATIKAVNNLITTHNLEKQGLNQKILTLQNELTQYKRQLSSNVKIRGQDLENWVANEIENAFGTDDYFRFEREKTYFQQDYEDRKTVRKRADFELQFLNYLQIPNQEKEPLANNQNKQVVFKVIIECKTVLDDGVVSSAKNKEYYHQLISYAKIAQASYGILVSELERNGENDWLIYQVKNEEIVKNNPELTLFVVRPEMLVPLLLLLKKFSMTEAKLTLKSNSVKAKAQMKQAILVEYEKFKEDLLTTTFKYIKDDYKKITDWTKNIQTNATAILNLLHEKVENHLKTMANKLEKFTPTVKKQQKTILAHHLDKLEQEDFQ